MWCACPTRSPHSPSASSCPKPIPLLNLRPSPAEWAPYPTARTVPRMCERFFCTPAQVPPAFLRQTPASARTSPAAEPKTRSSRSELPLFCAEPPPPLVHPPPPSRKLAHSRSVLPPSYAKFPPPLAHPPSVGTPPPSAKAKPLIGTTRPRRRPRLHRTRHKNAPTLPRLGEKT